jgi:hypothetical protein
VAKVVVEMAETLTVSQEPQIQVVVVVAQVVICHLVRVAQVL